MVRALLLVSLCATGAFAQDLARVREQIGRAVGRGDFAAAVETARGIGPIGARLALLAQVAVAQCRRTSLHDAASTIAALLDETSKVADVNERMLRLAALAWFHERRLVDRFSSREGDVHQRTAEILTAAVELLPDTDPAAVGRLIDGTPDRADRIHSRMVWTSVRGRSGAETESVIDLDTTEVAAAITRVEHPATAAYLLTELANMATFAGDEVSAAANLGQALLAARSIEALETRLMTFRAIARAHAARRSPSGLRDVVPALLADLERLPARHAAARMDWLLEVAELQAAVGARTELIETLDSCDELAASIARDVGPARTAAVRDRSGTLRLTNGDAAGYLRHAKATQGTSWRLRSHLDERIRWLLGLGSKDSADFVSRLLGRKPTRLDLLTASTLLQAMEIEHAPFQPGVERPTFPEHTGGAAYDRDRLCSEIVDKAVGQGELAIARVVARQFVTPRYMGDALIAIAEAQIADDERDDALRTLDDALTCFDADKRDLLPSRGSKAIRMGLALHAAGRPDRAVAVLERAHWILDGDSLVELRMDIAARLAAAYHEIGERGTAWRLVGRILEMSRRAPDPAASLASAAATLQAAGYAAAAAEVKKAAAQPPR